MGRKLKYENPEDMQVEIDKYFNSQDEKKLPYTVPGLALALGFLDRSSINDYAQKDNFFSTIKKAKMKIENQRVEKMLTGENVTAGSIFDLCNNFGYVQKSEKKIDQKIDLNTELKSAIQQAEDTDVPGDLE